MPARSAKPADASKSRRSATRKRPLSAHASVKPPDHGAIAERAYFIHLKEGSSDQLANWLRAERELAGV